jgi:hypothetical protein
MPVCQVGVLQDGAQTEVQSGSPTALASHPPEGPTPARCHHLQPHLVSLPYSSYVVSIIAWQHVPSVVVADDSGEDLRRLPSTNTIRSRRLAALSGNAGSMQGSAGQTPTDDAVWCLLALTCNPLDALGWLNVCVLSAHVVFGTAARARARARARAGASTRV